MMPLPAQHPNGVSRLDFVLPMFLRVAWVNDHARENWERRLACIASRWREIEWRTIVDGVRRCALVWLSHDELVALVPGLEKNGLCAAPLTSTVRPCTEGCRNALVYRVVIA